jgi:hypothetical protein
MHAMLCQLAKALLFDAAYHEVQSITRDPCQSLPWLAHETCCLFQTPLLDIRLCFSRLERHTILDVPSSHRLRPCPDHAGTAPLVHSSLGTRMRAFARTSLTFELDTSLLFSSGYIFLPCTSRCPYSHTFHHTSLRLTSFDHSNRGPTPRR